VDRDEWLPQAEWARVRGEIRFWGFLGWGMIWLGLLLLLCAITNFFSRTTPPDPDQPMWAVIYTLASLGFHVTGLAAYARHKGLPAVWGLLGLSGPVGPLILRFLPKRCRNCGRACPGGPEDCPGCGAPI
jgi:hypothetical protein